MKSRTPMSRRHLLVQGCAALCACQLPLIRFANAGNPETLKVVPALRELPFDAVQLGPGPLRKQFEQQQRLYLGIDDDRLLKPFRQRAGLPAPGADMGGWYDDSTDFLFDPKDTSTANWHGFIAGHSFGQYLSGLARGYAITRDAETKRKVAGLIGKFAPTISPKFFDDYNLPAYTYDKLVVGLIDAWQYAGVTESKEALDRLTDAVLPFLPEKSITREERRRRPHKREAQIWDETYTLPENLFLAWQRGFGQRYRDLAGRYLLDDALFDPLAKGVSPFEGKHAYSHVNSLCSAVQAYLTSGDTKYLAAARNGFDFVRAQSYATGGWGPNEELLAAGDHDTMLKMLTETHRTFETPCGAYAHFKLTRYLMRLTLDGRYGDSMERVLYNTILGAKPTLPDGSTFYYSDYHERATKFYRGEAWPCCSGTFVQLAADYGISSYLQGSRGLVVNLYVPSIVRTSLGGADVTLTQSTGFPFENTAKFRVETSRPAEFELRFRVAEWAGPRTRLRLNGKELLRAAQSGGFLGVNRPWRNGDEVEIEFDMKLRLEPLNEAHPGVVALMYGPLALFAIDAPQEALSRETWLAARRQSPRAWSVQGASGPIKLLPFMDIGDESYRLYQRLRSA